jgi:prevent-host-death family protein
MSKRVSATDAKNNFGGLLDDVAALGRVDIVKHGRLVAVVLSPQAFDSSLSAGVATARDVQWGQRHMIPPKLARAARMLSRPSTFDED